MCSLQFLFILINYIILSSIYFINHSITIGAILRDFGFAFQNDWDLPNIISYLIYLITPCLATYIYLYKVKSFDKTEILGKDITKIESASASFLPTFLTYVLVGLSINNYIALLIVYLLLTILCFCAETYLYNPIFHFLGYHFYFINTNKYKLLIITKKKIKKSEPVDFTMLHQLNDYTYFDI